MPSHIVVILTLIYVIVGFLVWRLTEVFLERRLDQRLDMIRNELPDDLIQGNQVQFKGLIERFLAPLVRLSKPDSEEDLSKLRARLMQGGFRSNTAIIFYYGLKTLLPLALIVPYLIVFLVVDLDVEVPLVSLSFWGLVLLAAGYYLPDAYLKSRVQARQREIFENFPDALDLIRVCVSAGLGLDSAISRVGQLIGVQSKVLGQDFRMLSLELRAGVPKSRALRNLATRTGLEEVNALVAMLIQADKFGTSVAESLKVHSEALRTKRKRKAQETAAKVPVKLTIPMMICILPALFVVILGPAILDVMSAF